MHCIFFYSYSFAKLIYTGFCNVFVLLSLLGIPSDLKQIDHLLGTK